MMMNRGEQLLHKRGGQGCHSEGAGQPGETGCWEEPKEVQQKANAKSHIWDGKSLCITVGWGSNWSATSQEKTQGSLVKKQTMRQQRTLQQTRPMASWAALARARAGGWGRWFSALVGLPAVVLSFGLPNKSQGPAKLVRGWRTWPMFSLEKRKRKEILVLSTAT